MSISADRMAKLRERQKFDRMVLTVTVDREPMADLLVESGLLHRAADDDRPQMELALETFLETVLKGRVQ